MKKAVPFLISGGITIILMTLISLFIDDEFQAKSTLVAGMIAGVVVAAIPIYDILHWSLLKRSLLHVAVMAVTVFPLLFYSGWYSLPVSVGVFFLFGVAGWTIGYVVNRFQTKRALHKE